MIIQFYTTLGCHLCEQAAQLLGELQQTSHPGLVVESVDIALDQVLFDQYGIRIPVVKREELTQDLGWPFTRSELAAYLE